MSATSAGTSSGVVLGIALVLLGQQFGYYSLSDLIPAIEYILIAAVIGGLVGAVIGYALGRLYLHRHPPVDPTTATDAAGTGASPPQ